MTARDAGAFDTWVVAGRAVRVVEELGRRGHLARLKRAGRELAGPCPLCGGTDRFAVNPAKDIWNCRRCGKGGDAIALVETVDGVDFLRAVEILTGTPAPGSEAGETEAERQARRTRQAAALAASAAAEAAKEVEAQTFREAERKRMWHEWQRSGPVPGTLAESYLRLRGVTVPTGAHLRFRNAYSLWSGPPPGGKVVHRGPALMAAILGPEGRFAGLHVTWIDLDDAAGKARVADPATGELVPAKKVRGSKRGGSILLAKPPRWEARTLILGEGIETVLSVRAALQAAGSPLLEEAEFRSAVDLGNMAGRAAGRVPHPTATTADRLGRLRRVMVASGVPSTAVTDPVIAIGGAVERIILIGDGDSEPFATRLALERAAARFSAAYPWVTVGLAMAPDGLDFNDLWRRMLSEGTAIAADPASPMREAS